MFYLKLYTIFYPIIRCLAIVGMLAFVGLEFYLLLKAFVFFGLDKDKECDKWTEEDKAEFQAFSAP